MNDALRQSDHDALDAYCDARLNAAERAAFEARLASEPRLRAELDQQRAIDASLRRMFAGPAAPSFDVLRPAPRTIPLRPAWRRFGWQPFGIAAALLLMVGGAWWQWQRMSQAPAGPIPRQTLAQNYEAETTGDFKPDGQCWNDKQFAMVFYDKLALAMTVSPPPPGVELLGIAYSNTMSPQTTMLMAVVQGRRVIAYVDRKGRDPGTPVLPPDLKDVRVFRRELDEVVIYEFTPLDQPHLLDLFKRIEMQPEWYEEWKKSGRPY
jgi:hypothetical protein